jgi:hypothetical protein
MIALPTGHVTNSLRYQQVGLALKGVMRRDARPTR